MRYSYLLLLAALSLSALAPGCGGVKPAAPERSAEAAASPQDMNWAFAPKALELTFVSDPFLNEYEGAAHTLSICVYQLSDPAAFRQMAATAPGVSKLLECAPFDPSVVSVQRVSVRPGLGEVLTLDRDAKSKYLAVACNYHDLNPGTATRIFEIPVSSDTSGWLWWKETTYQPGKLSRKIFLGKTGMPPSDTGQ
jgi:type VI secretion system VasD/TssJ family lipoprotein